MAVLHDASGEEAEKLLSLVDFSNKRVLEIGCGDGRLTWRYAQRANRVVGIDPDGNRIRQANQNKPAVLTSRVNFEQKSLEEFSQQTPTDLFDRVIFAWSF